MFISHLYHQAIWEKHFPVGAGIQTYQRHFHVRQTEIHKIFIIYEVSHYITLYLPPSQKTYCAHLNTFLSVCILLYLCVCPPQVFWWVCLAQSWIWYVPVNNCLYPAAVTASHSCKDKYGSDKHWFRIWMVNARINTHMYVPETFFRNKYQTRCRFSQQSQHNG